MYCELWEGEADTFLVESVIDELVHFEHHVPIVFCLRPDTNHDIHTAGIQCLQHDHRSRCSQDTRVGINDSLEDGTHLLNVFTILHAKNPLQTTRLLLVVVGHGIAAERTVGDVDHAIVRRGNQRMENLNLLNRTTSARSIDIVAHLERLEDENNQSARKVGQIARQSHTDGNTRGGQQGSKAGSLDTQLADDGKGQYQVQHYFQQAAQEGLHTDFHLALYHQGSDETQDVLDDKATDNVDDQSGQQALTQLDTIVQQAVQQILHVDDRRGTQ